MRPENSFHLLLVGLALTLAASLPLYGDEPPNQPDGSQASVQTLSAAEVSRELATLKESLGRLEGKVDRLLQQPSEFSPVEVRIVDEQGKPMSGFGVELTSSDQAQRARASGLSNDEGVALTRHLPYGVYQMSVRGNGWYARDPITVEVGTPLELTVVAPTPHQLGELVLEAALPYDTLAGLPFGGWKIQHDNDWGTRIAPEPEEGDSELQVEVGEEPSNGWKSFPTVSDGIETVAIVVVFDVNRHIEQPDGKQKTWQWRSPSNDEEQPHMRWLVQSDGTLRPLLSATEKRKEIGRRTRWFEAVASKDNNDEDQLESFSSKKRLGYSCLKLGEEHRAPESLRMPAGRIEVTVDDIYGRPSRSVLKAIGEPAESSDGQLWLPAVVSGDSKWLGRVLGSSMTVEKSGSFVRGFSTEVDLSAEETQTITIGTGKPKKPT